MENTVLEQHADKQLLGAAGEVTQAAAGSQCSAPKARQSRLLRSDQGEEEAGHPEHGDTMRRAKQTAANTLRGAANGK